MPDIKFKCRHCNQSIEAPEDMRGEMLDCPACTGRIIVPDPIADAAKPKQRPVSQPPFPPPRSPTSNLESKEQRSFAQKSLFIIVPIIAILAIVIILPRTGPGTIEGQVFVVTKGGQSIKLGLVPVRLIEKDPFMPYISNRLAVADAALAKLRPEFVAAARELRASLDNKQSDDVLLDAQRKANDMERFQERTRKFSEAGRYFYGGEYFFESLPPATTSTKTDPDGRFRIPIPALSKYVLAATASRQVGDSTEIYYWLLRIDNPKARISIMLSNDNMLSFENGKTLLAQP